MVDYENQKTKTIIFMNDIYEAKSNREYAYDIYNRYFGGEFDYDLFKVALANCEDTDKASQAMDEYISKKMIKR